MDLDRFSTERETIFKEMTQENAQNILKQMKSSPLLASDEIAESLEKRLLEASKPKDGGKGQSNRNGIIYATLVKMYDSVIISDGAITEIVSEITSAENKEDIAKVAARFKGFKS